MKLIKNKQYLLQGPSGSGKTTSMNLLLDYYEASSGNIKINNLQVSEIKNLNNLITVMRQDATLFEDTLRNNITMYQSISDDKLIAILSKVGLGGYANYGRLDMVINEGGTNLSGGEKRRVTLARSLIRETPILILDEPMANLDEENAKAIESLILEIKDRTVIIISHQFSKENITRLDEIIEFK
jgi:ABC-type transport system involved in cytochrome bd biosynthesis fused ATPase/permease subunit